MAKKKKKDESSQEEQQAAPKAVDTGGKKTYVVEYKDGKKKGTEKVRAASPAHVHALMINKYPDAEFSIKEEG